MLRFAPSPWTEGNDASSMRGATWHTALKQFAFRLRQASSMKRGLSSDWVTSYNHSQRQISELFRAALQQPAGELGFPGSKVNIRSDGRTKGR
jgi:hypothetical protein